VQGVDKWRHENGWPLAHAQWRELFFRKGNHLSEDPTSSNHTGRETDLYTYDARAGTAALAYDACCGPIPYPQDQVSDDLMSLTFDTDVLDSDLEITGEPEVRIFFSTSSPLDDINLVAKLCDVSPNGSSYLITHDNLNATRSSIADDRNGTPVCVAEFQLRPTSYVVSRGHRLRISISGSNFPHIWPTPYQYELEIHRSQRFPSSIRIPVIESGGVEFESVEMPATHDLSPPALVGQEESYFIRRALVGSHVGFEGNRYTAIEVEPGVKVTTDHRFEMNVDAAHPETANSRTTALWELERSVGFVQVYVVTTVTWHDIRLDASITLDGHPYFKKSWSKQRSS
jgi:hypothetical protein